MGNRAFVVGRRVEHDGSDVLTLAPSRDAFRWLPRHGKPTRGLERLTQGTVRGLAMLPVYTALIVTLVLLLQIFGVPFIGGR